MTQKTTITGEVVSVFFQSEWSGDFAARVALSGSNGEASVRGKAGEVKPGQLISATGRYIQHPVHGPQFEAESVTVSMPSTTAGVIKLLQSDFVKGIGPKLATQLVAAFGNDTLTTIINHPERLQELPGLGKKKIDALHTSVKSGYAMLELAAELFQYGLTQAYVKKVYKRYGDMAAKLIKANPYRLCEDVYGIGFRKADEVALKLGHPRTSKYRISAGIRFVLNEAVNRGSCGLPTKEVLETTLTILNHELPTGASIVTEADVKAVMNEERRNEVFVYDKVVRNGELHHCLFLPAIYHAEKGIASFLKYKATMDTGVRGVDALIRAAEAKFSITLAEQQRQAVAQALEFGGSVITGGPGTGKTTTLKVLIHALHSLGKVVLACAPSGKAAKRISEATDNQLVGSTVHRMLGAKGDGTFNFNAANRLNADVIVLDEASMIDVYLMRQLCAAIDDHTTLIIVGDVDQLPSVGPGKVLFDIIQSAAVPTTRLNVVFRQAQESQIIVNSATVNGGHPPSFHYDQGSDFVCITEDADDPLSIDRQINFYVKKGYDPIRDIQVLAPMRKGVTGIESLNRHLKQKLNPMKNGEPHIKVASQTGDTFYTLGDKVMQLKNNYESDVFNGDVGFVTDVDEIGRKLIVTYDGTKEVSYLSEDMDQITLAYAFTIHKSQGGEFPVVIMPFTMKHYNMLKRNVLYTGMTRAKKVLVLLTEKRASAMAAKNNQIDERYSKLLDFLKEA